MDGSDNQKVKARMMQALCISFNYFTWNRDQDLENL
jgi:hypothetical protein